MSKANFFTTLRIVFAPVFFIMYFFPIWTGSGTIVSAWILFPFFLFMEFTDFLDGFFARKENNVSDFGKLFDPFADVLANLTVLLVFVIDGYLPAVLFLIILYREMAIMFVRMLASRKGVTIAARKGGKLKTVLYIVAAGYSLLCETFIRLGYLVFDSFSWITPVGFVLYCLAVLVSIISFVDYLAHFGVLLKSAEKNV